MKSGYMFYPKYLTDISAILGGLRNLFNIELMERNEKLKRGEREEAVNTLGIRAELIVQSYLCHAGKPYTSAPFIGRRSSEPDIISGGYRIDVKGVRPDSTDLLVNAGAHRKNKNLTHYWFVQPLENQRAAYWLYQFSEVNQWAIKEVKYSKAYYTNLIKPQEEKNDTQASDGSSEQIQGTLFTAQPED